MASSILVFGFYLSAIAGIAYVGWRRTHTLSDYVLGGRSLSPFTAAISTGASNMSAWAMMTFPALAYTHGIRAALIGFSLLVGQYVSVRLVAPRLRVYSEQLNDAQTLPKFLCERTGRGGKNGVLLRGICSLILLFFMLVYVASGLLASGKLLVSLLGISLSGALILGAVVIGGYTLMGGFLAISWTDVLQGLMMVMVLIGLPLTILAAPDAPAPLIRLTPPSLENSPGLVLIISSLSWGLGYIGLPHGVMRYKAIRDVRHIPTYRRILMCWLVMVFIGGMSIGLLAQVLYPGSPVVRSENITLKMIDIFFNPWMAGLAFSAIMAAIMSTADSQLLLASVSFSEDIVAPLFPQLSPSKRLHIGRWTVLFITIVSLALVLHGSTTILALVSYAWAGLGSAFGPVLVFALFWRRFSYAAAVAGVATGGLGTILLHTYLTGVGIYELVPAFSLSTLVIWLVGRYAGPDPAAMAVFDQLNPGPGGSNRHMDDGERSRSRLAT